MLTFKSLNLLTISFAVIGAFTAVHSPAMAQLTTDHYRGQSNQSGSNADWYRSQNNRTWEDYSRQGADMEQGDVDHVHTY